MDPILEHSIDLSKVTSTGLDRTLDIMELIESLPPVDLNGRIPVENLPSVEGSNIGLIDEVGFGPEGYRDHISSIFAVDQKMVGEGFEPSQYICTYAVKNGHCGDTPSSPESAKGYNIQIAVDDNYQEFTILPKDRALAEALHHTAVSLYKSGCSSAEIKDAVGHLASRLGVQAI